MPSRTTPACAGAGLYGALAVKGVASEEKVSFAADSPLEQAGFNPIVPVKRGCTLTGFGLR